MDIVGILTGDQTESQVLQDCINVLGDFGVGHWNMLIEFATGTEEIFDWVSKFVSHGGRLIIVCTDKRNHLVEDLSKRKTLTVIKVPYYKVGCKVNHEVDQIYKFSPGLPIATVAINNAKNAALLAIAVLSITNIDLRQKLKEFRQRIMEEVQIKNERLQQIF